MPCDLIANLLTIYLSHSVVDQGKEARAYSDFSSAQKDTHVPNLGHIFLHDSSVVAGV